MWLPTCKNALQYVCSQNPIIDPTGGAYSLLHIL